MCSDFSNGHDKRIKDSFCTLTTTVQTKKSTGGKHSTDEHPDGNVTDQETNDEATSEVIYVILLLFIHLLHFCEEIFVSLS